MINTLPRQQEEVKYQNTNEIHNQLDYRQGNSVVGRLFMLNVAKIAFIIKKALNSGLKLNFNHIPKLMDDQKVEYNSKYFIENLDKVLQKSELTPLKVWFCLLSVFKKKIMIIVCYMFFNISLKLFNSVALNFCIQAILNQDQDGSYLWGAIMMISMLLSSLFRQNDWTLGYSMNTELRGAFAFTIYKKINNLSAYEIKKANLGKVINLVSSDLNIIEAKFIYLFQLAASPYTLGVACIILSFRLGPLGMLSILFLILTFPIQRWIGKMASRHTSKRIQKSDERIKLINEILEGIRIVKIYGWEEAIKMIIEKIRSEEIRELIRACVLQYIDKSISISSVLLSAALTFMIIYYQGSYELNSAKIFSTIEMLSYLRTNLMMYSGYAFGFIFELQIFLKRFIEIYSLKQPKSNQAEFNDLNILEQNELIKFQNFYAYWNTPQLPNNEKQNLNQIIVSEQNTVKTENEISKIIESNQQQAVLKNISLSIKFGDHVAVVGKIGSGKTSFLQCFLEEIPYFEGIFQIKKQNKNQKELSFAYVEQEPYIFSSTVRENILFGAEYNEQWYSQVVKSCCLITDLEQFQNGDSTVIGERGVNLSGGQKARICFARAIYRNADLYLLDDPLSAVDSKVAFELVKNCILGLLKDKTIILVTHQIHFTKYCDKIIMLGEEGSIQKLGKFEDLQEELKKLAAGQLKFEKMDKNDEDNVEQIQTLSEINQYIQLDDIQNKEMRQEIIGYEEIKLKQDIKRNEEKNQSEQIKISLSTYTEFVKRINQAFKCFPYITLILFILSECAFTTFNRGLGFFDQTSSDSKGNLFGFLIGFAFLYLILNATKFVVLSTGISLGNKNLHNSMFKSLIRAPILFFDKTHSGNLMNKFSNDVSLLDNNLHFASNDSLDIFCNFFNLMITCIVFNPYTVIPGFFELVLLFFFLLYCKDIINQTRQLDLSHKTPVFQHFQSTVQGSIAIKVYQQNDAFLKKMQILANNSVTANQSFWMASRFFGSFTQIFAILCSTVGVFLILSLPNNDPTKQAQSLTYFMLIVDAIQWCLRQMLTTDSIMSSFERVKNISTLESEAPLQESEEVRIKYQKELQNWPQNGQIEFQNVFMRYSKETNPVLKGLSFKIQPGQKIGCVGRTGAGKSSVLQTLFRLTEPEEGSIIKIDGIDTSQLGLHTLRQRISIIPQIPFVFQGTIRRNLDPFNQYRDDQIWESLKMVELDYYVKNNCLQGLYTDMSIASSVFSVGQKQLICLARALLKKNKILVLDEATANVDMETDNLIQKTIRSKFNDSTVLTIAHRLNTIADYDKIIVMNEGVLAEFDSPFNLLAESIDDECITKQSLFAQMVKNTGKNNSQTIFQISKKKFLEK
ncbi:ABC transporter C family protein (macronuclear) [Tetrahymena thermophila SB210]|uniref:ABC transporter C family protein n=1 Tax=Tetrahymena thermophila (strain SB210) TaxID=312017 RepID=Q239R9_TETTS|nr:ABC transporter C family protein [Tetrahymena thermophila SB210]EAR93277.2 ABC transporter C family protein [Tetrahymena thermophila SB210]|eukprot:XP_001013522.2 ABC transporter C family protein [Tetrahymena thermophila SB210]